MILLFALASPWKEIFCVHVSVVCLVSENACKMLPSLTPTLSPVFSLCKWLPSCMEIGKMSSVSNKTFSFLEVILEVNEKESSCTCFMWDELAWESLRDELSSPLFWWKFLWAKFIDEMKLTPPLLTHLGEILQCTCFHPVYEHWDFHCLKVLRGSFSPSGSWSKRRHLKLWMKNLKFSIRKVKKKPSYKRVSFVECTFVLQYFRKTAH